MRVHDGRYDIRYLGENTQAQRGMSVVLGRAGNYSVGQLYTSMSGQLAW